MLSLESALAAVARELDMPIPPPEKDGERIFALDGALRLGIQAVPDGSAHIAWSVASESRSGESPAEAEERAAVFLRAHLGRLRAGGRAAATRDAGGAGVLYVRSVPATEAEWLRDVAGLLDETETMRNILSDRSGGRASGSPMPERSSLFSGMAGLLRER